MNTNFYVYKHTFANGTLYIGKGKGKRYRSNASRNTYWHNLKNKYGVPAKEIIVDNLTEEDAFDLENLIIEELQDTAISTCNISTGGSGCEGYKHTEEHKEYMSELQKEAKNTAESKLLLSKRFSGSGNPMYGKTPWNKGLTKDTSTSVNRAAKGLEGVPKSEGHKKALSAARQGKRYGSNNNIKHTFRNTVTGEVVTATTYYMKEVYGCQDHISSVVTGKRKQHKNWVIHTQ